MLTMMDRAGGAINAIKRQIDDGGMDGCSYKTDKNGDAIFLLKEEQLKHFFWATLKASEKFDNDHANPIEKLLKKLFN
jgi:hypothetical protein